jgi:hypothetical protein
LWSLVQVSFPERKGVRRGRQESHCRGVDDVRDEVGLLAEARALQVTGHQSGLQRIHNPFFLDGCQASV